MRIVDIAPVKGFFSFKNVLNIIPTVSLELFYNFLVSLHYEFISRKIVVFFSKSSTFLYPITCVLACFPIMRFLTFRSQRSSALAENRSVQHCVINSDQLRFCHLSTFTKALLCFLKKRFCHFHHLFLNNSLTKSLCCLYVFTYKNCSSVRYTVSSYKVGVEFAFLKASMDMPVPFSVT